MHRVTVTLGLLVLLVLGAFAPAPVHAALPAWRISLEMKPVATIGTDVPVRLRITDAYARPVSELRTFLYAGGEYVRSDRTNSKGEVSFVLRDQETAVAGVRSVEIRLGDEEGSLGIASRRLKLEPALVTVASIPAIAGVPIRISNEERLLEGDLVVAKEAQTDPDGVAVFRLERTGRYDLVPDLEAIGDADIRVSFLRWGDAQFHKDRLIDVAGDARYELGIKLAYRGSMRFEDLEGRVVEPRSVSVVRATGSVGAQAAHTRFEDTWWEAAWAVKRTKGLVAVPTVWRLTEVRMAGTNVVNRGQQSWLPTPGGTWTIKLLLYELAVTAEDALTGSRVPGVLELVYPDGTIRTVPTAPDGTTRFEHLPRGNYMVRLHAQGTAPPEPVALSRSQSLGIRVITYFDLIVSGTSGLLMVGLLLWFGRRHQLAEVAIAIRRRVGGVPAVVGGASGRVAVGARRAVERVRIDLATVSSPLERLEAGGGSGASEASIPPMGAERAAHGHRDWAEGCLTCGYVGMPGAWFCVRCGSSLR